MNNQEAIWKVSALNFEIKTLLEKGIGSIWIEGEISNFARPASGHWYFSLKDERAQVRAAMFKNRNGRVAFTPENGQQVLIRAQVTLYEARGEFQLIVEHMEEAGVGRLMREYEALKKQLDKEGLFSQDRKQPIPDQARHIGIITSPSGAAVRDALSVIQRRSPSSEVTIYPTPVQGEQATGKIIKALQSANQHAQCDVLLLIRGGGSLEDLWCFNEESLARAIADSRIPVVSGVGHEIDFTIADFVADFRAPTPSVAAETVTMDQFEVMTQVDRLESRLLTHFKQQLNAKSDSLHHINRRLLSFHPERQLDSLKQRLNYARSALIQTRQQIVIQRQSHCLRLIDQLHFSSPHSSIQSNRLKLDNLQQYLSLAVNKQLEQRQHSLGLQAKALDTLSPLKTLSRGFAAISKDKKMISSVKQLNTDDKINIRLQDGQIKASVSELKQS